MLWFFSFRIRFPSLFLFFKNQHLAYVDAIIVFHKGGLGDVKFEFLQETFRINSVGLAVEHLPQVHCH